MQIAIVETGAGFDLDDDAVTRVLDHACLKDTVDVVKKTDQVRGAPFSSRIPIVRPYKKRGDAGWRRPFTPRSGVVYE